MKKLDRSTAIPGLSRDDCNAVEVVIAPMEQQEDIVAKVDRYLSIIRGAEVDNNLQRAQALRQTTLARSFKQS